MSHSIAFLGTNHPAVETLKALASKGWVAVVVMPPDTPEKNAALEAIAQEHNIPTTYELKHLMSFQPDLLLAANYPKVVPKSILEQLPCLNTHWSALPHYRGVHGTAWAILNGEESVGCTLHWMSEAFDEGDIISQKMVTITPELTLLELHKELGHVQAKMVLEILESGKAIKDWPRSVQDHEDAIYVPQRMPDDGLIDWSRPSELIANLVRVLPTPEYPGAFTYLAGRKLIVAKARRISCPQYFATEGQVVRVVRGKGVWVKSGDTCVEIQEVIWDEASSGKMPADVVLRRGDKLGFQPQLELHKLREEVAKLRSELKRIQGGNLEK